MTDVICSYCGSTAVLVTGAEIYPHRPDLSQLSFYKCNSCVDCYVGCHKGTTNPLGRLANAELRKWKSIVHKHFDPYWRGVSPKQEGIYKRGVAYAVLAELMKIDKKDCHIGMFTLQQCKQAYLLIKDGEMTHCRVFYQNDGNDVYYDYLREFS